MKLFEIKTQIVAATKPQYSNDIAAPIGDTRYIKREGKTPGSWKQYNLIVVFGGASDTQSEMMVGDWVDKYAYDDPNTNVVKHDGFANGEVGFQEILFVHAAPESRVWDMVAGNK